MARLWETENKRNTDNTEVFCAVIREAFPNVDVAVTGHHLIFTQNGSQAPQEIPSADYLIFDHYIAQKIWGSPYLEILSRLSAEPKETRDALFCELYLARNK